jgi:MFS family permease
MNALISLPAMLAPFVAGLVLRAAGVDLGMRGLYAYLMCAYLVSAVIKGRFLRDTVQRPQSHVSLGSLPRALIDAYSGLPALYRQSPPSLRAVGVIIILSISANALAGPFWVVYAVERIGLSAERWGLVLLLEAALLNVAYIPSGQLADRWGRARCQQAGLALALLSSISFMLAREFYGVLASRLAVALAMALFIPANTALVADLIPRGIRGRVMAAIGRGSVLLLSPGGGIGGPGLGFVSILPVTLCSLAAGLLYGLEARAPWIVLCALFAAALGLSLRLVRDPQTAEI